MVCRSPTQPMRPFGKRGADHPSRPPQESLGSHSTLCLRRNLLTSRDMQKGRIPRQDLPGSCGVSCAVAVNRIAISTEVDPLSIPRKRHGSHGRGSTLAYMIIS